MGQVSFLCRVKKSYFITALLALYLLSISALWSEEESGKPRKLKVAILDIKARTGIIKAEARIVTDLLTTEMVNLAYFHIIERGNIKKILKEQAFQKSGLCSTSDCAVKVGQLLAADLILVGSVSRLEKKYLVNIRIIDVEKGRIKFAASGESKSMGDIKKAVSAVSISVYERLAGKPYVPSEFGRPTLLGALWRSALIPGWGSGIPVAAGREQPLLA